MKRNFVCNKPERGYTDGILNTPFMPTKKTAKKKVEKPIGEVTHFYDKISVGIVKLKAPVKSGEVVRFHGRKTDFVQAVASMQLAHKPIEKAPRGKEVGIKVGQIVHEGDLVYRAK